MTDPFILGDLQPLVDWCHVPPPPFAGDTHALRFWLNNGGYTSPPRVYGGLLFFRPRQSEQLGTRTRFVGSGMLLATSGTCIATAPSYVLPPQWVRIFVAVFEHPSSLTPLLQANLEFIEDIDGSPTGKSFTVEEIDVRISEPFRWIIGEWFLYLSKSTVNL